MRLTWERLARGAHRGAEGEGWESVGVEHCGDRGRVDGDLWPNR